MLHFRKMKHKKNITNIDSQMVISNFLKSVIGWFQYLKTSLNFLVYSDEFEKKTF